MKIAKLEIENVKKVKAVTIAPTADGLTVIGGKNGQGKTSVLDAIAWALGGSKYAPTNARREGSVIPPSLRVELDNGIIVERKGEKGSLKVTDQNGQKAGQALLDAFVEKLAIDLPKFMSMTSKEKAKTLLGIVGVEDDLVRIEREEQAKYNQRYEIGRIADAKRKHADEMEGYDDVPDAPMSALELIQQQQAILLRNAENKDKREKLALFENRKNQLEAEIERLQDELNELIDNIAIAQKSVAELVDESTAELEQSILHIDELNHKIRANQDKSKASQDADELKAQYDALSGEIDQLRRIKIKLLDNAQMPLPELSVNAGELVYKGRNWDCMSGAEQLMVAVAIVQKLNPECNFVLVDKLEQMDTDTMHEFGEWLAEQGLQAICTRVSTGNECEIIIEDGEVKGQERALPSWTGGAF